jgi:lipid-A-disaccharide synthase
MSSKIMIVAGEASGDLHGGKLVSSLVQQQPNVEIFGVGGDNMRSAGMDLMFHVEDLSFMGFTEVIKHLGDIRKVFNSLVEAAIDQRPDIIVLIDYPGFNLRLGKKLKILGFKIFYFIAPQVWAWHQSRAKKMAGFIDRMAVIFDFEVDFFKKYGIDARFVGHPLVDGLKTKLSQEEFCATFNVPNDADILGLFPGSRNQEIDQLLPTMIETSQRLQQKYPQLVIAVSQAETISDEKMLQHLGDAGKIVIIKNAAYELMSTAKASMVASGTATLETACFQTPFVLLYKVSPFSYFIGKRVVKIPLIGLVNIVAGKEVVKEFIQENASADIILAEIEKSLFDAEYRNRQISELGQIKMKLGAPGASSKTAELILEMISE